jgi:hypothetical protein
VARVRPARHRWIDGAPARYARGDRPVRPDVSRDPATLARISQDPLNGLILDAIIAPYQQDERELLVEHLAALEAGSLLLLGFFRIPGAYGRTGADGRSVAI